MVEAVYRRVVSEEIQAGRWRKTEITPYIAINTVTSRMTPTLKMGRGVKKTWCLTFTETTRLIRDREKGVWRWGEREIIIYLSIHCHHQNDFYIKVGSDESYFNVS